MPPTRRALLLLMLLLIRAQPLRADADFAVLAAYPREHPGFTQGLELRDGRLYESSGLYGKSFVRYGSLTEPVRQRALPQHLFAEGLTLLGDQLYLLTWRAGLGLVLDPGTLAVESEFRYSGEGWGLTNNGHQLIMSDGTARLRFIDPQNFQTLRELEVIEGGTAVSQLNELEWRDGLILANQWKTDDLLVIDESSGRVLKRIDLGSLYPAALRRPGTDVMNGIAYDAVSDSWLVTGKYWPRLYRLRLELPEPVPSVRAP